MGEILRAILETSCIDSRTAFYSFALTYATTPGALTFGRRQASVQCKSDTWFLAMGWTQDSGQPAGVANPYIWETPSFPSTFSIQRASTGEQYQLAPTSQVLQNYNLNNFVTLDEYPLFAPAELILVQEDVRVIGGGGVGSEVVFVTIQGVEYQMPDGRDWAHG